MAWAAPGSKSSSSAVRRQSLVVDEGAVAIEKHRALRRGQGAALHHPGCKLGANAVVAVRRADVLDELGRIVAEQLRPARQHRGEQILAKIKNWLRVGTRPLMAAERFERGFFQDVKPGIDEILPPDAVRVRAVVERDDP